MKYFRLIKQDSVHVVEGEKIVPASEFSTLIEAHELLEESKRQVALFRDESMQECEQLKEEAKKSGFEEGLKQWSTQLIHLEKETEEVRKEMEEAVVPLVLTAIKKIIGRELEQTPKTIADIVSTSLKSLSQHHRIHIYVNKTDLELVEASRDRFKEIFEHLERLSISARDDVEKGGCTIETEAGIVNAQLENQLKVLESAFHIFFQNQKKEREHNG